MYYHIVFLPHALGCEVFRGEVSWAEKSIYVISLLNGM